MKRVRSDRYLGVCVWERVDHKLMKFQQIRLLGRPAPVCVYLCWPAENAKVRIEFHHMDAQSYSHAIDVKVHFPILHQNCLEANGYRIFLKEKYGDNGYCTSFSYSKQCIYPFWKHKAFSWYVVDVDRPIGNWHFSILFASHTYHHYTRHTYSHIHKARRSHEIDIHTFYSRIHISLSIPFDAFSIIYMFFIVRWSCLLRTLHVHCAIMWIEDIHNNSLQQFCIVIFVSQILQFQTGQCGTRKSAISQCCSHNIFTMA